MSEEWRKYPKSKNENFFIKDTYPEKHPYCITPKHLEYSNSIYLNIDKAEKLGAVCDICKQLVRDRKQDKILSYKEHKSILLIGCKKDFKTDKKAEKELNDYLMSIKERTEKDDYVGFGFIDLTKEKLKK